MEPKYLVKNNFSLFWGGPYSQWETHEIEFNSMTFNCNEQMMMYCKALVCGDKEMAAKIMLEIWPNEQKKLGKLVKGFSEEIWNFDTSMAVVYTANFCKFDQHEDLYEYLINDPGKEIVEASPHDRIWGIGLSADRPQAWNRNSWRGENRLGICITNVRKYFLENTDDIERDHEDNLQRVRDIMDR